MRIEKARGSKAVAMAFQIAGMIVILALPTVGIAIPNCPPTADCCKNSDCGDACSGLVCVNNFCEPGTPVDCDDGNVCTTDSCIPTTGACRHTPIHCNDGNRCTTDSCDPAAGCQFSPLPDGADCSDGNVCNGAETCHGGMCTAGTPLDCDDHNLCTIDSCIPATGCLHALLLDGASCSDGNACNGAETCQGGMCTVGTPPDCNDHNPCTADACDVTLGCLHTALANGSSCSDGNACNGAETCQGAVCMAGTPLDCDDHNPCTTDTCNPASGCVHMPSAGAACATTTTLPGGGVTCVPGAPLACDDGDPCTEDTCVGAGAVATCVHGQVTGLGSVSCICKRDTGGACGGQQVPGAISKRFSQACSLIGQAGATSKPKKAKALVGKANKALLKGGKLVAKATKKGKIRGGCAAGLDALFGDASGRAQHWLITP